MEFQRYSEVTTSDFFEFEILFKPHLFRHAIKEGYKELDMRVACLTPSEHLFPSIRIPYAVLSQS
jgi:hypothetical protein